MTATADRIVRIVENVQIARDTFRIRLDDPAMAAAIRPGQFLMIRPGDPSCSDPLLGRPFALYDVARDANGQPIAVDVVYQVLGRGTELLSKRVAGERLVVWGPLGNGFGPPPAGSGPIIFVAGGIGQTPFLALGRWWLGKSGYGTPSTPLAVRATGATLFYGARTQSYLAGVDDFAAAGIDVQVATDDGSAGHHGFVTDLLSQTLERGARPVKIVGCGPHPMLATLARIAAEKGFDCDVSLENHMACGFGACFSCVAPIRGPGGEIDLKRVCVEGPIFSANDVCFDQPRAR